MKAFERVEKLAAESDNQYTLALAMAKRVRALRDGAPCLVPAVRDSRHNAVRAAMEEFARGLIAYETTDMDTGKTEGDGK